MSKTALRMTVVAVSTALALVVAWLVYPRAAAKDPTTSGPEGGGPTFRIHILGESTSAGVPYEARAGIGRIVAHLFGGRLRGRPIEIVTWAEKSENSGNVRADTARLVATESDPEHALVIVYSGNNELEKFGGDIDLSRDDRTLFDQPLVDAPTFDRVLAEYEDNLRATLQELRAHRLTTFLSTIAVNLAGWEPDRSVLADPAHEADVKRALDDAEAARASGDLAGALARVDAALALEPRFAWASKQRGDLLRALGRFDGARAAYQSAIDDNGAPTVATSRHDAILRRLAAEERVALVDCAAAMRAAARDGLPGGELFWDNCHPRLDGYLALSRAFATAIGAQLGEPPPHLDAPLAEIERALAIDREYLAEVSTGCGQYLYVASRLIWNPRERLALSRACLESAAEVRPNDALLLASRGVLALLEHRLDESREMWRRALAADESVARPRLKHKWVRSLLAQQGVSDPFAWAGVAAK